MVLYTIKLCPKLLWRNLATVNLKLKKLDFFSEFKKKFCSSVFNVGGCLASCLTSRSYFNVRPLATWLLIKKRVFQINLVELITKFEY